MARNIFSNSRERYLQVGRGSREGYKTLGHMRKYQQLSAVLFLICLLLAGCGSPGKEDSSKPSASILVLPTPMHRSTRKTIRYSRIADAGADPSVPAEQGGKGFTGQGWETNTDFDLIGDPRAVKGGIFREYAPLAPGTYRMEGPEWNSLVNYAIANMMYEGLLALDPTTLKYIPVLATHWQISPDKLTFRFRINPNARWSDGEPVVADDVVRTWVLYSDHNLAVSVDVFPDDQAGKARCRKQVHRPRSRRRTCSGRISTRLRQCAFSPDTF